jgi:hypothetical protein
MPALATASRTSEKPLKSPLAAPSGRCSASASQGGPATWAERRNLPPRARQLADLADHLRSITNRWGRPYEENTISTYGYPAKALDVDDRAGY